MGGFVISDNPVKPGLHPGDERVIWAGIFRRYLRVEFADFGWFLGIESFTFLGRPTFFDPQFFWRLRGLVSPEGWTDFRFPPNCPIYLTFTADFGGSSPHLTNARLQDLKSQVEVWHRNVIPPWFFCRKLISILFGRECWQGVEKLKNQSQIIFILKIIWYQ